MRFAFLLVLFFSVFTSTSWARTEICGTGIDEDGSGGDLACSAPDQDRDGFYSDGTGYNAGTDCDDTNRYIYPGIITASGCSTGQFHTCQGGGTYNSCANISGFTCHSGSGQTYWISATGTTGAGGGTFGAPWDWRCFSNSGLTCYHAPVAGDCFVMKGGVYTSHWSSYPTEHQIYVTNRDGTSGNHIKLMAAPGDSWWEKGAGNGVLIKGSGAYVALPNEGEVVPISINASDYWDISGLEIVTNTGGFSNVGLNVWGPGTGGRAFNNSIHDIDGEEDNNAGCIKYQGGLDGAEIDHNLLYDCYEHQSTTGDAGWNSTNNSELRSMDDDVFHYHDNVVFTTNNSAMGISIKHGKIGGISGHIDHNVISDTYWDGIAVSGNPHTTIDHNFLDNVSQAYEGSITQWDLGSSTDEFSDLQIYNNTSVNSPCFGSKADQDDHLFGNPVFHFYNNICVDNRGTPYPTDGSRGFIRINFYGNDSLYAAMVPRIFFMDNCYYNTAGTTLLFAFFGSNGTGSDGFSTTGANYFGLSAWQSATGFDPDAGSFYENPLLNSKGEATSTHCSTKGWAGDIITPPTTTTSTTSTTTTTLPTGLRDAFVPYLK